MEQQGIGGVTRALIHLLEEKKRDGLILLNGAWGTGKTYFINNSLRNQYRHKTVFLVSTLGVTSLEEFKAELFSEFYIRLSDDINEMAPVVNAAISLSTQTPAAASVINNMMSGISNSIRKHILSDLNGVFAIDDIERIPEKLASEILGYCHSVYMVNNNIDFIIISNIGEESEFKIEHQEKIISHVVPFLPSESDVFDFYEIELSCFTISEVAYLKQTVKKFKLVNIRIIGRIISGLNPLFQYHKDNPEKEIKANLDLVIYAFSALVILSRQHHFTLCHIESQRKKRNENENENDKMLNSLLDAATASGVPQVLKEYAFSISSRSDVIDALFYDKHQIDLDEVVLSDDIFVSDVDENIATAKLIKIVRQDKNPQPLKKWYRAVRNYRFLKSNKYISGDDSITHEFLMTLADSYSADEVSDAFYIDSTQRIDDAIISQARTQEDIQKYLVYKYSYDKRPSLIYEVQMDVLHKGWRLFNTEQLEKLGGKGKYSLFQNLGIDIIKQGVFKRWDCADIRSFANFLASIYNITNFGDYLQHELSHLVELSDDITTYLSKSNPSFRYGAIFLLDEVIDNLIRRHKK